jgi:methyl-accepting chemotaxis protein/methyl-accepting chemotaxis protein-1 (serine sensor receptor)
MVSGVGALGALILAWVIGRGISSSLGRTASELAETANQVAAAAEQVASSSQSLAQGASEQAGSLEETSSSSDQIHAMAERNMDNSRAAAALVQSSAEKVEEASGALDQMVVAIGEIGTSSANIGRIIKVIEDIAFQTNILALNAAVEAARAGESGLGFAVVADEVRNLSQRCAQAAKDTAELIEDSIAKSKEGQVKVDRVAGSVHTVARDFCKVQALVAEVDEGSQEQARGIDQIAKAISQVEEVTRCAAANAEENAAASEELTAQSRTLHDVSETLLAMIRGARAAR